MADCYFIVAADVIVLYPNINRNTLRDALTTALNLQSQFCALGQRYFVELIMLTLESVITYVMSVDLSVELLLGTLDLVAFIVLFQH